MITFIEKSDVEKATIDACTKTNDEIGQYCKAGKGKDASNVSNLMASSMIGTRNTMLLSLLIAKLITEDCYRFCKQIGPAMD